MAGKKGKGGGVEGEGNVISLPFALVPKKRSQRAAPRKPKAAAPGPAPAPEAETTVKMGRGGLQVGSKFTPPEKPLQPVIPFVPKSAVPGHVPTEQGKALATVARMAGIEDAELAAMIGVDMDTLYAYYGEEMRLGDKRVSATIVAKLANTAKSNAPGSITAAIYWTKAVLGWRDGGERRAPGAPKDGEMPETGEAVFVFDIGEKGRGKSGA